MVSTIGSVNLSGRATLLMLYTKFRLAKFGPELTSNVFYLFLMDELRIFENKFSDYLINNSRLNRSEYNFEAIELITRIISRTTLENLYVLSFNYSKPNFESFEFKPIFSNIHGEIGENIIIGIDNSQILKNNEKISADVKPMIFKFSKTARQLIRNIQIEHQNMVLAPNIEVIRIYGHSLSDQDYSYFQCVFDFYNLYQSKVRLIFYFSDDFKNSPEDKERYKTEYTDSVIKLIQKYASTLDGGSDRKNNLLHKLLLEHRTRLYY